MTNAPTIAAILFDAEQQQQPSAPIAPAVVAWGVWFDILREQLAAASGRHPLRAADLFDAA